MNTIKLIDAEEKLTSIFKDTFDRSNKRIRAAVRHGISEAINRLKAKTKQNISGSWFRSSTSEHYSAPLVEGVKAYMMCDGLLTGFVDILGNTRTNDGTWRLRFFEGGTVERKTRSGKKLGKIKADWFFNKAYSSLSSEAVTMIQNSVDAAVKEINDKA